MNIEFLIIIFVLLFAVVSVAMSGGFRVVEHFRKRQVEELLSAVSGAPGTPPETKILRDRVGEDPLEAWLEKAGAAPWITRILRQAGLDWTAGRLAGLIAIGVLVGAVVGGYFHPLGWILLGAATGGAILGLLPVLFVAYKRRARLNEIEVQLPEALDFMARSMRAGHAFTISVEILAQEMPAPLGTEFRTLSNEMNLGAPLETALAEFADRVPLLDVRLFIAAVVVQKQTGGNLSEILVRLAYVIRERFKLKGQVRATSAHGRLTAMVLTILPLLVMVALLFLAPGYLQSMAKDSLGRWLIVGAIVAQVAGYAVMRHITNIKV